MDGARSDKGDKRREADDKRARHGFTPFSNQMRTSGQHPAKYSRSRSSTPEEPPSDNDQSDRSRPMRKKDRKQGPLPTSSSSSPSPSGTHLAGRSSRERMRKQSSKHGPATSHCHGCHSQPAAPQSHKRSRKSASESPGVCDYSQLTIVIQRKRKKKHHMSCGSSDQPDDFMDTGLDYHSSSRPESEEEDIMPETGHHSRQTFLSQPTTSDHAYMGTSRFEKSSPGSGHNKMKACVKTKSSKASKTVTISEDWFSEKLHESYTGSRYPPECDDRKKTRDVRSKEGITRPYTVPEQWNRQTRMPAQKQELTTEKSSNPEKNCKVSVKANKTATSQKEAEKAFRKFDASSGTKSKLEKFEQNKTMAKDIANRSDQQLTTQRQQGRLEEKNLEQVGRMEGNQAGLTYRSQTVSYRDNIQQMGKSVSKSLEYCETKEKWHPTPNRKRRVDAGGNFEDEQMFCEKRIKHQQQGVAQRNTSAFRDKSDKPVDFQMKHKNYDTGDCTDEKDRASDRPELSQTFKTGTKESLVGRAGHTTKAAEKKKKVTIDVHIQNDPEKINRDLDWSFLGNKQMMDSKICDQEGFWLPPSLHELKLEKEKFPESLNYDPEHSKVEHLSERHGNKLDEEMTVDKDMKFDVKSIKTENTFADPDAQEIGCKETNIDQGNEGILNIQMTTRNMSDDNKFSNRIDSSESAHGQKVRESNMDENINTTILKKASKGVVKNEETNDGNEDRPKESQKETDVKDSNIQNLVIEVKGQVNKSPLDNQNEQNRMDDLGKPADNADSGIINQKHEKTVTGHSKGTPKSSSTVLQVHELFSTEDNADKSPSNDDRRSRSRCLLDAQNLPSKPRSENTARSTPKARSLSDNRSQINSEPKSRSLSESRYESKSKSLLKSQPSFSKSPGTDCVDFKRGNSSKEDIKGHKEGASNKGDSQCDEDKNSERDKHLEEHGKNTEKGRRQNEGGNTRNQEDDKRNQEGGRQTEKDRKPQEQTENWRKMQTSDGKGRADSMYSEEGDIVKKERESGDEEGGCNEDDLHNEDGRNENDDRCNEENDVCKNETDVDKQGDDNENDSCKEDHGRRDEDGMFEENGCQRDNKCDEEDGKKSDEKGKCGKENDKHKQENRKHAEKSRACDRDDSGRSGDQSRCSKGKDRSGKKNNTKEDDRHRDDDDDDRCSRELNIYREEDDLYDDGLYDEEDDKDGEDIGKNDGDGYVEEDDNGGSGEEVDKYEENKYKVQDDKNEGEDEMYEDDRYKEEDDNFTNEDERNNDEDDMDNHEDDRFEEDAETYKEEDSRHQEEDDIDVEEDNRCSEDDQYCEDDRCSKEGGQSVEEDGSYYEDDDQYYEETDRYGQDDGYHENDDRYSEENDEDCDFNEGAGRYTRNERRYKKKANRHKVDVDRYEKDRFRNKDYRRNKGNDAYYFDDGNEEAGSSCDEKDDLCGEEDRSYKARKWKDKQDRHGNDYKFRNDDDGTHKHDIVEGGNGLERKAIKFKKENNESDEDCDGSKKYRPKEMKVRFLKQEDREDETFQENRRDDADNRRKNYSHRQEDDMNKDEDDKCSENDGKRGEKDKNCKKDDRRKEDIPGGKDGRCQKTDSTHKIEDISFEKNDEDVLYTEDISLFDEEESECNEEQQEEESYGNEDRGRSKQDRPRHDQSATGGHRKGNKRYEEEGDGISDDDLLYSGEDDFNDDWRFRDGKTASGNKRQSDDGRKFSDEDRRHGDTNRILGDRHKNRKFDYNEKFINKNRRYWDENARFSDNLHVNDRYRRFSKDDGRFSDDNTSCSDENGRLSDAKRIRGESRRFSSGNRLISKRSRNSNNDRRVSDKHRRFRTGERNFSDDDTRFGDDNARFDDDNAEFDEGHRRTRTKTGKFRERNKSQNEDDGRSSDDYNLGKDDDRFCEEDKRRTEEITRRTDHHRRCEKSDKMKEKVDEKEDSRQDEEAGRFTEKDSLLTDKDRGQSEDETQGRQEEECGIKAEDRRKRENGRLEKEPDRNAEEDGRTEKGDARADETDKLFKTEDKDSQEGGRRADEDGCTMEEENGRSSKSGVKRIRFAKEDSYFTEEEDLCYEEEDIYTEDEKLCYEEEDGCSEEEEMCYDDADRCSEEEEERGTEEEDWDTEDEDRCTEEEDKCSEDEDSSRMRGFVTTVMQRKRPRTPSLGDINAQGDSCDVEVNEGEEDSSQSCHGSDKSVDQSGDPPGTTPRVSGAGQAEETDDVGVPAIKYSRQKVPEAGAARCRGSSIKAEVDKDPSGKKAAHPPTDNATNPEVKSARKRKWASSSRHEASRSSWDITTDSLKGLIDDVHLPMIKKEGAARAVMSKAGKQQARLKAVRQGVKKRKVGVKQSGDRPTTGVKKKVVRPAKSAHPQKPPLKKRKTIEWYNDTSETNISLEVDMPEPPKRAPSPARNTVSRIVHVSNLVRPFTVCHLVHVLRRTGNVLLSRFWINSVKSHCFVTYTSKEEAIRTRKALHGARWPLSSPKTLHVDYSNRQEMDRCCAEEEDGLPPVRPSSEGQTQASETADVQTAADQPRAAQIPDDWETDSDDSYCVDSVSAKGQKKRKEAGPNLFDELYRKTKASPCIFWLPLSEQKAEEKDQIRQKEREAERKKKEAEKKKRNADRKRRATEKKKREAERRKREEEEAAEEAARKKTAESHSQAVRSHSAEADRSRSHQHSVHQHGGNDDEQEEETDHERKRDWKRDSERSYHHTTTTTSTTSQPHVARDRSRGEGDSRGEGGGSGSRERGGGGSEWHPRGPPHGYSDRGRYGHGGHARGDYHHTQGNRDNRWREHGPPHRDDNHHQHYHHGYHRGHGNRYHQPRHYHGNGERWNPHGQPHGYSYRGRPDRNPNHAWHYQAHAQHALNYQMQAQNALSYQNQVQSALSYQYQAQHALSYQLQAQQALSYQNALHYQSLMQNPLQYQSQVNALQYQAAQAQWTRWREQQQQQQQQQQGGGQGGWSHHQPPPRANGGDKWREQGHVSSEWNAHAYGGEARYRSREDRHGSRDDIRDDSRDDRDRKSWSERRSV